LFRVPLLAGPCSIATIKSLLHSNDQIPLLSGAFPTKPPTWLN